MKSCVMKINLSSSRNLHVCSSRTVEVPWRAILSHAGLSIEVYLRLGALSSLSHEISHFHVAQCLTTVVRLSRAKRAIVCHSSRDVATRTGLANRSDTTVTLPIVWKILASVAYNQAILSYFLLHPFRDSVTHTVACHDHLTGQKCVL